MDLIKAVVKGGSRVQAAKIADYVGNNRALFNQLINIYIAGPFRITQLASWPLTLCTEAHPTLIRPHLKKILDLLKSPDVHATMKRNTMRLLQFIEIPAPLHGRVADLCYQYLLDKKEPIAVKVFSMSVMLHLSADLPELQRELRIILEDQLPFGSPAFVSRARKVLKSLHPHGHSN